ncbi:MAG: OsmC family protein [Micrococcales bacterium]|nr:OsmC family protein [Micrococcales bacterium]
MSQVLDAPVDAPVAPQLISVDVAAGLVGGTATEVAVRAGQHAFTIDEPASLGGTDRGANPVEHLLAALAGCTVISYQVWAGQLGIALDGVNVEVHGDLDTNGFFGLDESTRAGFQGIDLQVRLTGPESAERYRELAAAVEAHCPVLDNLTNGVPVRTRLAD